MLKRGSNSHIYPVRNNAPLLPPGLRPSGPAAAAGLDFRIIPVGFNAPLGFESQRLEFLTGFTCTIMKFSLAWISVPAKGEVLYVP